MKVIEFEFYVGETVYSTYTNKYGVKGVFKTQISSISIGPNGVEYFLDERPDDAATYSASHLRVEGELALNPQDLIKKEVAKFEKKLRSREIIDLTNLTK